MSMTDLPRLPRLLVAAPSSGSGKTVLTLALLRAFRDAGLAPAAFKCGPDYIDPLFHRVAGGGSGGNLDLYFSPPDVLRGVLLSGSAGTGIAVLEGAMGLYDGIGGGTEAGAWHVATETGTPVVLALRAKGAFLSLAAVVNGFAGFRSPSCVAGVVLSCCSPALHEKLAPVLERETGLRVFGFLPEMAEADFPHRHLGLAAPEDLEKNIAAVALRARETLDIPGLISLARSAPPISGKLPAPFSATTAAAHCRIAVSRDAAFSFLYRENLDALRALGAEVVFFSPLAESALPEGTDALYLCGGYPELHARELSENTAMLDAIASAIAGGMPALAEGGGFLYLHEMLQDADGIPYRQCGVIRGNAVRGNRLRRFGYAELTTLRDGIFGQAGTKIRGHEFHCWDSDNCGDSCHAEKPSGGASWLCGHMTDSLYAGFPQLSFLSNPGAAANFVRAAGGQR